MNKQDNKLTLSVLATLATGIALAYILILYADMTYIVVGISVLFLISAFILTRNIIIFSIMRNKSIQVHLKDCVDDISTQIEAMNGAQSQIGKATFLYTKQAAQAVSTLEHNYIESQDALYKNLASLSHIQNKATKLMIKYDLNNTTKIISTLKDMRNHLSDTMVQGFDQIQPDSSDIIAALESIVEYLKSQPNNNLDQTLSMQLNSLAQELQSISSNIQKVQIPVQPMVQPVMQPVVQPMMQPVNVPDTQAVPEPSPVEEPVNSTPDNTVAAAVEEDTMDTAEEVMEEVTETVTEAAPETEDEEVMVNTLDEAENVMVNTLDEDEDVMVNTLDEAENVMVNTLDENASEEFTPTFTVVGKEEEAAAPAEEPATPTIGDLSADPNKQLSPDEIAALFAAADPAPKKAEKPAEEPVAETPALEDPNKQLSPDEIAALFAAADPAPKKEEEPVEEPAKEEAAPAPQPAPVSDDPNKQLSPDEIAALFASLG